MFFTTSRDAFHELTCISMCRFRILDVFGEVVRVERYRSGAIVPRYFLGGHDAYGLGVQLATRKLKHSANVELIIGGEQTHVAASRKCESLGCEWVCYTTLADHECGRIARRRDSWYLLSCCPTVDLV